MCSVVVGDHLGSPRACLSAYLRSPLSTLPSACLSVLLHAWGCLVSSLYLNLSLCLVNVCGGSFSLALAVADFVRILVLVTRHCATAPEHITPSVLLLLLLCIVVCVS